MGDVSDVANKAIASASCPGHRTSELLVTLVGVIAISVPWSTDSKAWATAVVVSAFCGTRLGNKWKTLSTMAEVVRNPRTGDDREVGGSA